MATLIMTAKLNDVDPLADVLARIADMPATQLAELLWDWTGQRPRMALAS
jgi:transposase